MEVLKALERTHKQPLIRKLSMQIEKSFRPKIDAYKSLDASGGGVFRNTHPLPQVVLTAPPRQLRRSRARIAVSERRAVATRSRLNLCV